MKTTLTFRHMKPSPAVKNFVTEKIEKLDRVDPRAKEVHVILSLEKSRHDAEVIVSSKNLKAAGKASTQDMYTSIEAAIGKVEKTLRRRHDKRIRLKRSAAGREAFSG